MNKQSSAMCNQEIYDNGQEVFYTHTIYSEDVERWVRQIAKESCQKVDWHYFAGRAIVLAIGDLIVVKKAIVSSRPLHDRFYTKAVKALGTSFTDEFIRYQLEDIWKFNRNKYQL